MFDNAVGLLCCLLVLGAFKCVQEIIKSADYQDVLECNVQPSVQKLSLESCMSSSRATAQNTHKKHPGMVHEETLVCPEVASEESRCKSHSKPMVRAETAVGGHLSNIEEFKQFSAEECSKLIDGYKKHLLQLSWPKALQPSTVSRVLIIWSMQFCFCFSKFKL